MGVSAAADAGYDLPVTDRSTARRVMVALQGTPVRGRAVLVGSSSLLGFETRVPALTEDIDVCVSSAIVESAGGEIVRALALQGYAHEPGTATFVAADGVVFDLLGHDDPTLGDHIAGHGELRAMVFEDLSSVLQRADSVEALDCGGSVLTPAAFVTTKLLTERMHKGSKDKLQALLVISERAADAAFSAQLEDLLGRVDAQRLEDVRAAALEAYLAMSRDPHFSDAGAEGYLQHVLEARAGLDRLLGVLDD